MLYLYVQSIQMVLASWRVGMYDKGLKATGKAPEPTPEPRGRVSLDWLKPWSDGRWSFRTDVSGRVYQIEGRPLSAAEASWVAMGVL
jgi:hypothetical protein